MEISTKILLIITSLLTTCCAVINDLPNPERVNVKKNDFSKLNCRIANYPTTAIASNVDDMVSNSIQEIPFWNQLNGDRNYFDKEHFMGQLVTIEFESDKRATAKLWHNDTLLATKTLKGRIKKGYFNARPYFLFLPFVPLIFGYNTHHYRIGMTNDSITVDYKWNFWLFAIFAGTYSKGQTYSTFERQ